MCSSDRNLSRRGSVSDFRSAFEVLDADSDGKISREDLKRFYAGFSNGFVDDETIETMISSADSNSDGLVEYEEFERVLGASSKSKSNRKESGFGVMEDVFKVMDKDGDGKLSHDDLKSFMNCAGFSSVSDADIKAMISLGGGDEKEGVSFDGLLKVLGVDFAA